MKEKEQIYALKNVMAHQYERDACLVIRNEN
jgi:hypothetical protein